MRGICCSIADILAAIYADELALKFGPASGENISLAASSLRGNLRVVVFCDEVERRNEVGAVGTRLD